VVKLMFFDKIKAVAETDGDGDGDGDGIPTV
jgi:hypothetical protein